MYKSERFFIQKYLLKNDNEGFTNLCEGYVPWELTSGKEYFTNITPISKAISSQNTGIMNRVFRFMKNDVHNSFMA